MYFVEHPPDFRFQIHHVPVWYLYQSITKIQVIIIIFIIIIFFFNKNNFIDLKFLFTKYTNT